MTGTGERGSVSVLAAGTVALVTVLAAGLGVAVQILAAWSQAAVAADAAALAAAPLTFLGGSPAGEAARFAAANGGRLVTCRCASDPTFEVRTVEVRVIVATRLPVLGEVAIPAMSRAEFDPLEAIGG